MENFNSLKTLIKYIYIYILAYKIYFILYMCVQNSHSPLDVYKLQRKICVILCIPTNNHLA